VPIISTAAALRNRDKKKEGRLASLGGDGMHSNSNQPLASSLKENTAATYLTIAHVGPF
jgi:hypothetical protein